MDGKHVDWLATVSLKDLQLRIKPPIISQPCFGFASPVITISWRISPSNPFGDLALVQVGITLSWKVTIFPETQ